MLTNGKEHMIILHHNNAHTLEIITTQARGKSPRHNTQAHSTPESYSKLKKRDGHSVCSFTLLINLHSHLLTLPEPVFESLSQKLNFNKQKKKQLIPGQTQFSPAPYLCPPPACVADWSSVVSPPDGSECAPQCSLLEGEGQAQLKTHKAPGTGSPDRLMEEGRRSRAEQNKTHINEWWRDVMEKQWLCTIRE